MLYMNPVKQLNQRWDFITKCRHKTKFRLF